MEEASALGGGIAVNQILYNLTRRSVEIDLLPSLRRQGVPVMAYSPVEQGRLLRNPKLAANAEPLRSTPAQLALAWLLAQPGAIVIPKAGDAKHVEENRAAADLKLTPHDLAALDVI